MKFDILIPTYNRSKPLIKNLGILKSIINRLGDKEIGIIVSDNASTDGTVKSVENFISENKDLNITLLRNPENIGLTKNVIKVIDASKADYILILGDDDFINYEYLSSAIHALEKDKEIHCILPACEGIDENGEKLGIGRDLGQTSTLHLKGISNVIENSHRSHQISGIIVKRGNLSHLLKENNITNLYPQIFIVSTSCLSGKCLHIPEYPVQATETKNKAWRYDDVGLLNDIFQNYKALRIKDFSQFQLERKIIYEQRWRALRYWKNPIKQLLVIFKIALHPNTSKRGHIFLPFILSVLWIRHLFSKKTHN